MYDITSSNATITLSTDLFSAEIQQFSADTSFESESQQVSETRIGIDGTMVAGQIPSIKVVTLHLEASSPSTQYMRLLKQAMETNQTVYECQMVISIPSLGVRYTYARGVLHDCLDLPAGKNVLDPTTWTFHFNDVSAEGL